MTAQIKVKVQRKAIVKLKVLPKFPADVVAGSGIIITRSDQTYTFSLNPNFTPDFTLSLPLAIGDIFYASSATQVSKLADVATGNVLLSGGLLTAPAWGKVALATHVSGVLPAANGGTGVANSSTITLGGAVVTAAALTTSGANALTLTTTGATNVTLPTTGTLMTLGGAETVSGAKIFTAAQTFNLNTATAPAATIIGNIVNMAGADGSVAAITLTSFGNSTQYAIRRANGTNALPTALVTDDPIGFFAGYGYHSGGAFSTVSSAFIRLAADGNLTGSSQPGRIDFATTPSGSITPANNWRMGNDGSFISVGVTGGSKGALTANIAGVYDTGNRVASTATAPIALSSTTGVVSINAPYAALTASNGGIVYSGAANLAILAGTATANQIVLSGSSAAPSWSTATYPATAAAGTILAAGTSNTIAGTATPTLGASGTLGSITFGNATSGLITLAPVTGALGTVTVSLPAATDTLVGKATTDTFTNKTFDTAGSGNSLSINGVAVTANTGTGAVARAAGPTFTAPTLGAATATTINGNTFTTGTYTLTGTAGKTLTFSNSLTLAGTDATTITFQGTDTYVGRATTDTLTNKTLTSPVMTAPVLGAATGTSIALGGTPIVAIGQTGVNSIVSNATAAGFMHLRHTTPGILGPSLTLLSSNGAGQGTFSAVTAGNGLGSFLFAGDNGLNYTNIGAAIVAQAVTTWSATNSDANILLSTAPTGSTTRATRLTVFSDGGVLIGAGTTTPGAGLFSTGSTTVGALPTPTAAMKGARHFVTDSNAASHTAGIGAIVAAGGTTNVPVVCDGTNWRIG